MSEARDILGNYLQRTGLRDPADAAQRFQVSLLHSWIDHLDEVLDANGVPTQTRLTAMHADMTYWAERASIDPAVLADLGLPPGRGH